MNSNYEREIEINNWLIKARWYYWAGIISIALIAHAFERYNLPNSTIGRALLMGASINLFSFMVLYFCRKYRMVKLTAVLSFWQIIIELVFFTIVFYYSGGLESLSPLFFFLPIMSAGFFFGSRGAIITALISGLSVSAIVVLEYMNILPHMYRFTSVSMEYKDFSTAIASVLSYSVFYVIIGAYSGHISTLLIRRERLLNERTEKLEQESKYRQNEWLQLDKTAKLLVKRDRELLNTNREMDKKVKELQLSETAMLKAFADLKEGKKALEAEKNKTSAIIENIIDPIIVLNDQNKIEILNQSARTVFSFQDDFPETVIDPVSDYSMNNFKEVIKNEYRVKALKDEENAEEVKGTEELVINIEGQETTYKVSTASIVDINGDHVGHMKIFYNLTREKMIDKLKSEFITIAAHQLRTPLSAIKWVIKMVLDGDAGTLNEEQQQLLQKGYKSNERIITLVNDMLNVSRIEEGRFGYHIQKDSFLQVLENVLDSLGGLVSKKGIKLSIEKPDNFPELFIDAKKITLVVQNILENAIKYSPERGKINVVLKVDGQFVKFSVQDNGIGIPEADKIKLFSKFFRAENALRLQTEGSGLGLFIVRNIVKKHGGDINFESEEGVGTKFTVTLPLEFHEVVEKEKSYEVTSEI